MEKFDTFGCHRNVNIAVKIDSSALSATVILDYFHCIILLAPK
jgi:hypothetical protein